MKKNSELRSIARTQLKGVWLAAVDVTLIYLVIVLLSEVTVIGLIIFGGPLALGFYGYFIRKARNETVKLENLLDGFKLFGSSFLLYLAEGIFIGLWSCLFLIPGIVKSLSYSMSYYILRDNPNLGALEAITASRKMMDGYKGKLFGLYLSFIGWALLSVITCGIGLLWLIPYIQLTTANFYEDLKGRNEASISTPDGQDN